MSISSIASANSSVAPSPTSAHAKAVEARAFSATLGQLNQQIDDFEHQSTWRVDHDQNLTLPTGVTAVSATSAAAPSAAKTIADGFAALESDADSQLKNLTPDEQAQVSALKTKLTAETARFQGFISRRASTLAKAEHHVQAQDGDINQVVSDFEHQVTWQIDHSQTVTGPNDLNTAKSSTANPTATSTEEIATDPASANSSSSAAPATTGLSLAQTIANGFAAIESSATTRLKNAPWQSQSQYQTLQSDLTAEASRFSSFATRRAAYQAANPKATQKDVTA